MSAHKFLLLASYRRGGVENFCKMLLNNLCSDFHTDLLLHANYPEKNLLIKLFDLIHTAYGLITKLKNHNFGNSTENCSFDKAFGK